MPTGTDPGQWMSSRFASVAFRASPGKTDPMVTMERVEELRSGGGVSGEKFTAKHQRDHQIHVPVRVASEMNLVLSSKLRPAGLLWERISNLEPRHLSAGHDVDLALALRVGVERAKTKSQDLRHVVGLLVNRRTAAA